MRPRENYLSISGHDPAFAAIWIDCIPSAIDQVHPLRIHKAGLIMATDTAAPTFPVTLTSSLSQPAATAARNTTEFLLRFPPFPDVPQGVEIISFHNFTEKGIRIQPGGEDNETEMDALGLPTVALASLHSTDWCKTETRRVKFNGNRGPGKKRRRKTGGGLGTGPTSADWEEYWEEREASYRLRQSYDP